MRLLIHVHGRFHARTEPWRYEDFPAQHRAERSVKVFYREQTPSALRASPPLWGEGLARCWRLSLPPIEGRAGEGSARVQRTDGTDLVINAPSVHIISLYLALSRSILQGAKFVQYLCNRNKALINKFNSISNFTTMGTFNNNTTWGKVLNIVITILTAIATTFGVQSCV